MATATKPVCRALPVLDAISVLTVISCIQVPISDTAPQIHTLRKSRLVASTRCGDIGLVGAGPAVFTVCDSALTETEERRTFSFYEGQRLPILPFSAVIGHPPLEPGPPSRVVRKWVRGR